MVIKSARYLIIPSGDKFTSSIDVTSERDLTFIMRHCTCTTKDKYTNARCKIITSHVTSCQHYNMKNFLFLLRRNKQGKQHTTTIGELIREGVVKTFKQQLFRERSIDIIKRNRVDNNSFNILTANALSTHNMKCLDVSIDAHITHYTKCHDGEAFHIVNEYKQIVDNNMSVVDDLT